ncbi:hypothetical protein [Anaplasma phagocytophilum]|uniref:hypothetical protein n=1 Tax=Anaplasma phagocytophilum TaxID=948 RepID=UPI00201B120F
MYRLLCAYGLIRRGTVLADLRIRSISNVFLLVHASLYHGNYGSVITAISAMLEWFVDVVLWRSSLRRHFWKIFQS